MKRLTMTYADTDFFLAILKSSDWLKENAVKIMKNYTIETSEVTYIELMLLAKKYNLDFIEIIKDVMAICHENNSIYIMAAEYIKNGVNVFDAFHAAHCNGEIISSDHIYDKLDIKRIKLED